jgi:hypothetical protein
MLLLKWVSFHTMQYPELLHLFTMFTVDYTGEVIAAHDAQTAVEQHKQAEAAKQAEKEAKQQAQLRAKEQQQQQQWKVSGAHTNEPIKPLLANMDSNGHNNNSLSQQEQSRSNGVQYRVSMPDNSEAKQSLLDHIVVQSESKIME